MVQRKFMFVGAGKIYLHSFGIQPEYIDLSVVSKTCG